MSVVRKIRCSVEKLVSHGDQVYTVELKPDRILPLFQPGQFLHLALDDYDPSGFWPESRVFSIASSPLAEDKLVVIYSVKGAYTTRMERELGVGKTVWVKLPYGEFVVDSGRDAVLIAGGTGITAFLAFIEGLPSDHPRRVVLLYGARHPGLLLGRARLDQRMREVPNFRVCYFAETLAEGVAGVTHGRVIVEGLCGCARSASTVYYLAGPPPMVAALRGRLAENGLVPGNIRVDAWE